MTKLGAIVHPLVRLDQKDDNSNTVRHPPLLGMFGLYVAYM